MIRTVLVTAVALIVVACASVPRADTDEIEIRDQWAAKVPPDMRDRIEGEAQKHTGWGEKRKLEYEVDQFQKYVKNEERKARATSRRSTTRVGAPHMSTTRHATTDPATTNEAR